jgi:hypothetical protein
MQIYCEMWEKLWAHSGMETPVTLDGPDLLGYGDGVDRLVVDGRDEQIPNVPCTRPTGLTHFQPLGHLPPSSPVATLERHVDFTRILTGAHVLLCFVHPFQALELC